VVKSRIEADLVGIGF